MKKIAVLGFGTIGQGVADVLDENKKLIENQLGEELELKYILDLREFPAHRYADRVVHDFNIILNDPEIALVAEMMGGSHPAFDFAISAMNAGKSVVTSNKEVVSNFGAELLECARKNGVRYLFEASVGGGIPVIRTMTEALRGTEICEIFGILNGTTNYILTKMEREGVSMEEALSEAQKKGYAEADPTADVEGIDARRKISILAALAFGQLVPESKISTEGITSVTINDMENAKKNGCVIKLIAHACRDDNGKLCLSVAPRAVEASNPLASVDDVFNAVMLRGNTLGNIMLYGAGAGALPTASAVMADILDILMHGDKQPEQDIWVKCDELSSDKSEKHLGQGFSVLDKNAALSKQ